MIKLSSSAFFTIEFQVSTVIIKVTLRSNFSCSNINVEKKTNLATIHLNNNNENKHDSCTTTTLLKFLFLCSNVTFLRNAFRTLFLNKIRVTMGTKKINNDDGKTFSFYCFKL